MNHIAPYWYCWAGTRYASEVQQRPPVLFVSRVSAQNAASVSLVPVGSPGDARQSLAIWSPIPYLGVNDVLGWPNLLITSDIGHSGKGEDWGGAILLLPWGLISLAGRLWTHKAPCSMGPIQWAPCPSAHPHLPLISHHFQRKTLHLHASRTWSQTSSGLHNLQRNDRAIIHCVCGVTTKEQVSSQDPHV